MKKDIEVKDKSDSGRLIAVSTFKKEIRETSPHRHHGYCEMIYLTQGAGVHVIDDVKYPISPASLFIIRREQVHHWSITEVPEGYVLLLKKELIENSLDTELVRLFETLCSHSYYPLQADHTLDIILDLLMHENNIAAVESLFKIFLIKVNERYVTNKMKPAVEGENIYNRYCALLNRQEQLTNNVAYYADLLHTTPQNLNTVCRKAADKTAAQVLAIHIIREPKRLLYYTSATVSEIGLALGFKDSSHFVKYFKRHTGSTPLSFRRS